MSTPLEYLEKRLHLPWLIGYSTEKFYHSTLNYFKKYNDNHQQFIVISTVDKLDFLAQFIAATSTNAQVFLVNPASEKLGDWGRGGGEKVPTIMIPTGGSSGEVKFAQHTWQTLKASVEGFATYFESTCINSVCLLPLYHVSGLMQAMRSLITGGKLFIYDYSELKKQPPEITDFDYFISLVPTQLKFLLEHYPAWLQQFKTVLLGGAPAWSSLLEAARTAKIPLALTYGMTETASQIVALKPANFLGGNNSNGRILPHAKVTIQGEKGEVLPPEEIGTIVIESSSLCLGYYYSNPLSVMNTRSLPRKNRACPYPGSVPTPGTYAGLGGVFKTDDLGYFDQAGYLYIVGRNSQKIITGGEKVYPKEVEEALLNTGLVQDVVVIGYPDSYWGEVVTAVYVGAKKVTIEELKAAITPCLIYYKQPKKWLEVEKIPRNAQGKVSKPQLEEMIKERDVL